MKDNSAFNIEFTIEKFDMSRHSGIIVFWVLFLDKSNINFSRFLHLFYQTSSVYYLIK